ncbi:hypothetical protein CSUI_007399 [Cystoisospora suis]|uniref:Uncharacterized protein n=1 Tax=Cystoisospora suis TaxID=483139 RepID=A0A2C6KE53_9APIC|nr:hypothetical protein CSUI_007399 [Cystoisospora suis]
MKNDVRRRGVVSHAFPFIFRGPPSVEEVQTDKWIARHGGFVWMCI